MGLREPAEKTKEIAHGRVLLVLAALLWSTSGAFVKSPPLQAIPQESRGPLLACFRALAAAAVLIPFVRPKDIRWRPTLVPLVLSFTAMNALFVTALTLTTAAAAVFLQYTSTVWAFAFGVLLLGERIDKANLFALACAIAGIGAIVSADWATQNFWGNALALGSGVGYAGVIVSLKQLRTESSPWLVALCHAAAGIILLPFVLVRPVSLGWSQGLLILLFGIIQMGLPYVIFARALRFVSTQEAALLTLIEPILNPIWVSLLWGERVAASTWTGGLLIVGGLVARYLFFN